MNSDTNQELDCSTVQGSDGTQNTTEPHLTLVQYCSLAPGLCVSSCTNTTEPHLTLVQYCSLAPGLCVSSCTNTTECHLTLVQYCSLAPGLCVHKGQMALSSICT
jgi:hypothetical protein